MVSSCSHKTRVERLGTHLCCRARRILASSPESLHRLLNHVFSMRYQPCNVCPVSARKETQNSGNFCCRCSLTDITHIKLSNLNLPRRPQGVPGTGGTLSKHLTSKCRPVKLPSPSLASAHGKISQSSPFVALLSRTTCSRSKNKRRGQNHELSHDSWGCKGLILSRTPGRHTSCASRHFAACKFTRACSLFV